MKPTKAVSPINIASSSLPPHRYNVHLRREVLVFFGAAVNFLYHFHAFGYLSKYGIALAIAVVVATKVKARLVADANKEFGVGGAGILAGQREGPVDMPQPCLLRVFMRYALQVFPFVARAPQAALYQFGRGAAHGLVILAEDAVKTAALVKPGIDKP